MSSSKSTSRAGKYSIQFRRTVARTGKWRGKKAEDYVKYTKKKTKKVNETTKQYIQGLRKKHGNSGNDMSLIIADLKTMLNKLAKDQAKRPY